MPRSRTESVRLRGTLLGPHRVRPPQDPAPDRRRANRDPRARGHRAPWPERRPRRLRLAAVKGRPGGPQAHPPTRTAQAARTRRVRRARSEATATDTEEAQLGLAYAPRRVVKPPRAPRPRELKILPPHPDGRLSTASREPVFFTHARRVGGEAAGPRIEGRHLRSRAHDDEIDEARPLPIPDRARQPPYTVGVFNPRRLRPNEWNPGATLIEA